MLRPSRLRTLIGGLVTASLLLPLAPATAQVEAEIDELERRRDEIGLELAEIDAQLSASEVELTGLDTAVAAAEVQIELVADDFERAVEARREPAATRIEIAIVGFTAGDPRDNALLDEIRVLSGVDDEDPARARELYSAVIDDAQARLARADERLRALTGELTEAREHLDAMLTAQADAEARRRELGSQRAELAVELEEAVARLDLLRELQGTMILTGITTFDPAVRPALAIKIDNVGPARPQSGIAAADIVYVEEVEGGLTRFAAVFHSTVPAQVGPVRSIRTSDFDLLGQFNSPLFSNSGGNRVARELLRESSLVDIGAATNDNLYFRTSRPAPHNLYTNPANLWAVGQGDDYPAGLPLPIFRFREPGDGFHPDAEPAQTVRIDYGRTVVEYEWNGSGWARSQDGQPTRDADGTRIAPTTVIVQVTRYTRSLADAASPEAITVGSGTAFILSDGQVLQAAWRRGEATEPIEYVDESTGNLIEILPGRTWVELPREGGTVIG